MGPAHHVPALASLNHVMSNTLLGPSHKSVYLGMSSQTDDAASHAGHGPKRLTNLTFGDACFGGMHASAG